MPQSSVIISFLGLFDEIVVDVAAEDLRKKDASLCCHSNLFHSTLEADGRRIVAQIGRLPLHPRLIRTSFRAKLTKK